MILKYHSGIVKTFALVVCFVLLALSMYFSFRDLLPKTAEGENDGRRAVSSEFSTSTGEYRKCSTTLNDCVHTTGGGGNSCVNITSRRVMPDGTTLEPNGIATEGYCLPVQSAIADSGQEHSWLDADVDCNSITSSPILAKHITGRTRRVCRCHWPTLFGQLNLFSDCNLHHACDGGKGTLVHKVTRRPLTTDTPPVRIHDYECSACDRCNVPGPDPHTGLPSCLPRTFNDRDRDMCIYDVDTDSEVYDSDDVGETDITSPSDNGADYRTTKPMLSLRSRFVNAEYLSAFTDRVRNTAWLPNPCAFDLFTGARLNGDCELRMTRKSNIAYCAPTKDNVATAVKDDTYLALNRGRYPNTCFRFTSNEEHVNGYVIEYFLRKREGLELPSPVVSMRIAKHKVLNSVLTGLGLSGQPDTKMLLFTQPEPPADVSEFPHPFNARGMAAFDKEVNNWIDRLPAKCVQLLAAPIPGVVPIAYNCSAPVQPLIIPECSKIGEYDRNPSNRNGSARGSWIGDQTEMYAKSTVACVKPEYDARFPLVPNYNVSVGSTNADPTSAILFFDKSTNTVYPHWKNVGANVSGELSTIGRYTREKLRSVPNET